MPATQAARGSEQRENMVDFLIQGENTPPAGCAWQ
jgi:hypothetical protein